MTLSRYANVLSSGGTETKYTTKFGARNQKCQYSGNKDKGK